MPYFIFGSGPGINANGAESYINEYDGYDEAKEAVDSLSDSAEAPYWFHIFDTKSKLIRFRIQCSSPVDVTPIVTYTPFVGRG